MKKTLCVVMMLIISIFAFAGCGGAAAPEKLDRWEDKESETYKISLLTANWFEGTSVEPINGEVPTDKIYTKTAGVPIVPQAVDGEMKYTISQNDGKWVLDVTMWVKQTYATANFVSNWKSVVTDSTVYEENGNTVTFTSTMTSQAVFNQLHDGGKPVSSFKTVKSVVVFNDEDLKHAVAYNDYRTETAYEDNKAITKFDDKTNTADKQTEKTVDVGSDLIFDNEAMLLAIRSINLEQLRSAQQMTLDFFNGTEQAKQQIAVAYGTDSFKFNANDENAPAYYRIAATPVGTGYAHYYYIEQHDKIMPSGSSFSNQIPAYKLEQMNQGYMNFARVSQ